MANEMIFMVTAKMVSKKATSGSRVVIVAARECRAEQGAKESRIVVDRDFPACDTMKVPIKPSGVYRARHHTFPR